MPTVAFGDTVKLTVPAPLPLAPETRPIQVTPFITPHPQPLSVRTPTLPGPPLLATDRAVDESE